LVPNIDRRRNLPGGDPWLITTRIAEKSSAIEASSVIAAPRPKRFFVYIIEAHTPIYTASAAAI
jgi:hypothetical protein